MRELDTIQTKEKLNEIWALCETGPGGASYTYCVQDAEGDDATYLDVFFQKGSRKEVYSQHGVIDSDLLEIVRDRLKAFQAGPFASEYNEEALKHVECALKCLNQRVEDRIARNVLGKNEK